MRRSASFDLLANEPDVRDHLDRLCQELRTLRRELPIVIRRELQELETTAGHFGADVSTPLPPIPSCIAKVSDTDHQITSECSTMAGDPVSQDSRPSRPSLARQQSQTRTTARKGAGLAPAVPEIPSLKMRSGRAKEVELAPSDDHVDLPDGLEDDLLLDLKPTAVPSEVVPTAGDEVFRAFPSDSKPGKVLFTRRAIRARVYLAVHNVYFDYMSLSLVLMNAITIGLQTDNSAKRLTSDPTAISRIADVLFCIAFSSELGLRIFADGLQFFHGPDVKWNLFDCLLVLLQLTDEVIYHLASASGGFNFSFMRVLRLLRLVRVMRVMRILRLIGELRTIVSSIMGSLKSLAWTCVLLFLLVYVFGVYMTQVVLDHRLLGSGTPDEDEELTRLFGTLGITILSLYQAISGGIDWGDLTTPLMAQVSVVSGVLMVFYVAFAILALLNVVTGVFVESALKSAKEDRENYMLHHVRQLFESVDTSANGTISWEEFEFFLDNKHMREFFNSIDVDVSDAEGVFRILDTDDSGEINLDEFLNGCLGLHGPAKALHMSTLMCETRLIARHHAIQSQLVNSRFSSIAKALMIPEDELETIDLEPSRTMRSTHPPARDTVADLPKSDRSFATISPKGDGSPGTKAPGLPSAPQDMLVEPPPGQPLSLPGTTVRFGDLHGVRPI